MFPDIDTYMMRLNNIADIFLMECLLKDVVWSTLMQLWVVESIKTGKVFSSEISDMMRKIVSFRLQKCQEKPVEIDNVNQFGRQKMFSNEYGYHAYNECMMI
ncbi:unnamed protein product [Ectocarpus sp. 13 AM-2016]